MYCHVNIKNVLKPNFKSVLHKTPAAVYCAN